MSSMSKVFHEAPGRRADYKTYRRYREGLPHAIYYSQVGEKTHGCEKSEGNMVKNC